jgi:hypothetical protein
MIPDGEGGAFVVWSDRFFTAGYDIYAQRVDALGNVLWAAGGVGVCTATGYQYGPSIVSDGAGGVIVAWRDDRGADQDIYAQRLDGDGNPLWTADGVIVCNATNLQELPELAADGNGGAYVVWKDFRNSNLDIYCQLIDENGSPQWTANGVAVTTATGTQQHHVVTTDVSGSVIIAWDDLRSGNYDVYVQKLWSNGTAAWMYDGEPVCTETGTQYYPKICSTGSYFTVITWQDIRGADGDIYAQKKDGMGYDSWTYNGIPICAASGDQYRPDIAPDGELGVYITWDDSRGSTIDIYAQRVTGLGATEWTTDGIPVCTAPGNQLTPIMTAVTGGFVVVWKDGRSGLTHLFLQKIDPSGYPVWVDDGVPVCPYWIGEWDQLVAPDGDGGAIVVWKHQTVSNGDDIFAQRIGRYGNWGYPAPSITAVRDVPGDQGGYVNVAWDASRLDPWPDESIYQYGIWRAISEEQAMALVSGGMALLAEPDGQGPDDSGLSSRKPFIRMETLAGSIFYWEQIALVNADHEEHYSVVLPTLFDSCSTTDEYHYFQVTAYSSGYSSYWTSLPDSGYSVDNLAPAAPLALEGEQMYSPEGLQLTWDPNTEPDLAGYNIYRGTSGTFEPGPSNFVASTPDTATFDGGWDWSAGYWYKVSAVDIHGNESIYAVLGPDLVTGDDPMPVPAETFLAQNYPNPFNPNTTIAFGLKAGGFVNLSVYDAAGRLVAVLINESRPAGQYATVWNGNTGIGTPAASGVYFYKLETKEFTKTRKMILLR